MKYNNVTLGQIEALINKLGGEDSALGILQGHVRVTTERISFPVWMEVEIGGIPKDQLLTLLAEEGFFMSDWAKSILGKEAFTTLPEKKRLKLVCCKVRDLNFTSQPTMAELQERIAAFGGTLCPAEVGPHLRRKFKDQPRGDIWLIMKQITDSNGHSVIFGLGRHDDGEWLDTSDAPPDDQWGLGDGVMFVLE